MEKVMPNKSAPEIYRVLRVLEYVGPMDWLEHTFANNGVKGTRIVDANKRINSAFLGDVPERLKAETANVDIMGLSLEQIEMLKRFYFAITKQSAEKLTAEMYEKIEIVFSTALHLATLTADANDANNKELPTNAAS